VSDVRVNRPTRQSRLNIQSGRQLPTDFRFPGEPEEGSSQQMQSWQNAGEGFSNWLQMEPGGFFKGIAQGVADFARPAADWYRNTIYPYTPGARFDPDVERPDSFLTRPIGGDWFRQGPAGGATGAATPAPVIPADIGMQDQGGGAPGRTIEELMALAAQYAPQPDYSQYRASLEDMVLNPQTGLSPRIQAMYNQLAERAGENQQRVADIYSGATGNVGAVYDTSAANLSDAFTSSQRQLADQMARLGVEEAAGQVLPQTAQQQASALAALEQGRAGGLSALERYGASSGDFSSQMGQVAQQRGLEQNEALLGALQRQLADSLGMEAQQRAQYNPMQGALDYLQLEQGLNPQVDPRAAQADAEFLYQQEQDDTTVFRQYYQDYYAKTGSQEDARELARADALAGIMGPRIQQRAMSDPNFVPMASQ
jgi:hypothetical protein